MATNVSSQSTPEPLTPPVGTTFFYLVTRRDACGQESIPGRDSHGNPIPNNNPCTMFSTAGNVEGSIGLTTAQSRRTP
jgi:hypothetical protein